MLLNQSSIAQCVCIMPLWLWQLNRQRKNSQPVIGFRKPSHILLNCKKEISFRSLIERMNCVKSTRFRALAYFFFMFFFLRIIFIYISSDFYQNFKKSITTRFISIYYGFETRSKWSTIVVRKRLNHLCSEW